MRLTIASNNAIKYACLHFHYAKAVPVNTLGYNVFNDNNEWCGVILYGTGANNHIGTTFNLPQGGGTGISKSCTKWQTRIYQSGSCNELEDVA